MSDSGYAETIALIERLHRRFLDVLRVELERLGIDQINNVQSLLLANIGDEEVSVGELMTRGYYLGSNVTYNLKRLVEAGLVEQQELPPPAARTVYALTTAGERIVPVLRALARFGLPLLTDPVEGRVRPRTAVYGALAPMIDGPGAAGRLRSRQ